MWVVHEALLLEKLLKAHLLSALVEGSNRYKLSLQTEVSYLVLAHYKAKERLCIEGWASLVI